MVKLKAIQKINPQNLDAEKKFYAQAVSTGVVDLKRLSYLISNQSTVSKADCYAVVMSLVHNVMDELQQGKIVKLDELGSFQVGIRSKGSTAKEDVSINSVLRTKMNFRPDTPLQDMLNNVKFTLGE
ncbi:HU family DNA-binding protein [Wenyingzhuangia sp. IMCC45574]